MGLLFDKEFIAVVANNRLLQRRRFEQRCWIALEPSAPLAECLLNDISHTGAKLILQTELTLPMTFDLYFTASGTVGRNCEVVWQTGKEVGLKFIGRAVPLRSLDDEPDKSVVVEA